MCRRRPERNRIRCSGWREADQEVRKEALSVVDRGDRAVLIEIAVAEVAVAVLVRVAVVGRRIRDARTVVLGVEHAVVVGVLCRHDLRRSDQQCRRGDREYESHRRRVLPPDHAPAADRGQAEHTGGEKQQPSGLRNHDLPGAGLAGPEPEEARLQHRERRIEVQLEGSRRNQLQRQLAAEELVRNVRLQRAVDQIDGVRLSRPDPRASIDEGRRVRRPNQAHDVGQRRVPTHSGVGEIVGASPRRIRDDLEHDLVADVRRRRTGDRDRLRAGSRGEPREGQDCQTALEALGALHRHLCRESLPTAA